MKTIQISDELYTKLIELAKEVQTQDNRSTANVFFQIEDVEIVPAWEGRSDSDTLYSSDHDSEFCPEKDAKEIKEYCFEHYIEALNNTEEEADLYFENYSNDDFCDYLIDELNFERLPYEEKKVYKNAFLTAKECERHLQANSHHYSDKARSYGSCAWRNNDMEIIHEFLNTLT